MGSIDTLENPIVFFDGYCNLCNASVRFIIKRDKKKHFKFASLQSQFALDNLPEKFTSKDKLQSLVVLHKSKITNRSTAVLTIAKNLSGIWPLLNVFTIVPRFLRDLIYDFIANNRYRWFGKKNECMIPNSELKSRFFD